MTKGNHLALIFLLLMVGIWATACGRMRTASPSGKVVPTVVSEEITPQNAVRLKPVARWGAGRMNGMALSPDGKTLAAASSTGIYLYNAEDISAKPRILRTGEIFDRVVFSPDGTTIAATGIGIELLDLATGATKTVFGRATPGSIWIARFSPDGLRLFTFPLLYGVLGNVFSVWETETGRLVTQLIRHRDPVMDVAISPDGRRIASVDFANNLIVWDAQTGMPVKTLTTFQQASSLIFDQTGSLLISGENNGNIELWNTQSWEPPTRIRNQNDEISCLRFRRDGQVLASASIDGVIALWDVRDWKPIKRLDAQVARRNTMIEFSPDGETIYRGDEANIVSLEVASARPLQIVNDFAGSVRAMAFSEQGGWLATSHDDGFVRLWSTRKEGPPVLFRAPGLQTQTLAFDTAGKYLYVGGLDQIAIFETETGAAAALANLKPMIGNRRDGVSHLAYDRESHRIASVDVNGRVTLWDASSGMQVAVLSEDERVNSPAFQANIEYSPNGKMLLTTGPNTLRIRNAETLEILKSIPTKQGFDLAFSPKSDTVAFTDLSGIVLWDIAAEGPKVVLQNNRMLRNLAYNRDGSLLAANVNDGRDKSLILWDTATGASVITLNDLRDRAQTFAFSPDNTKLAAGSKDGTITFWSISP